MHSLPRTRVLSKGPINLMFNHFNMISKRCDINNIIIYNNNIYIALTFPSVRRLLSSFRLSLLTSVFFYNMFSYYYIEFLYCFRFVYK